MALLIKQIGKHRFLRVTCRKAKYCDVCNGFIRRNVDYTAHWRGTSQKGSFHNQCGKKIIEEHADRETRMVRINKDNKIG